MRAAPLILLAAVLTAAALVACDDDDDDGDAATSTATSPAATGTAMAATTAPEEASALTITLGESDLGSYLVGPTGRTLYVFTRDEPGQSNCSDQCLQAWPPLLAEDGQEIEGPPEAEGEFDTIDTASGTQVTYNGAPLYYFAQDTAATDTKGHLVADAWFVARPDTASTAVVGVRTEGEKAPYLIGPTGMTLYLFANDTEGTSNCSGQCIMNWPPLTVPEGLEPTAVDAADGTLGVFVRDDGKRQVTYNGMPLYYWVNDKLPGDTTGDGVGGVWTLATP